MVTSRSSPELSVVRYRNAQVASLCVAHLRPFFGAENGKKIILTNALRPSFVNSNELCFTFTLTLWQKVTFKSYFQQRIQRMRQRTVVIPVTCHSRLLSTQSSPRGSSFLSKGWFHSWNTPAARDPGAPSSPLLLSTRGLSPARWPSSALFREALPKTKVGNRVVYCGSSLCVGVEAPRKSKSDPDGAAYDSSTVVNLQQVLKQPVLLFLVLIESSFLQVDEFTHSAAEIHHSVSGVSPLQGLIGSSQPGQGLVFREWISSLHFVNKLNKNK